MSLTAKRTLTAKKVAANRANARRSRGPVTPQGKARAAAANLRHGYYSRAAEVALTALGEDPAEFKRRLDSLIDTCEPANALDMGLVMQTARALWRMERFHRIAESLAVKHLEKMMEGKRHLEAFTCFPLFGKMDRLKKLFAATCLELDPVVGPEEMKLFEQCRGDVSAEKASEILRLLLRLRKPGATSELPVPAEDLEGDEDVPVAEGEARKAVKRELGAVLAVEIEGLNKRILKPEEDPDKARAQIDRDIILASGLPQAELMNRGEEASLRQVWRTTQLLMKIKKERQAQENIKNEEWSQ